VKLPDAKVLRYTREEASTLFENLHRADPRVQLAIQLGAELRAGQAAAGCAAIWTLARPVRTGSGPSRSRGRGKKHGETVHLTPAQRDFVDQCLGSGGISTSSNRLGSRAA
jgi:hypothetical protein